MRRLLLRLTAAVGVAAVLLVPVTPALAHGGLRDGSPGPGDVVAAGSSLVRLEFLDLAPGESAHVSVLGPDVEPRRVSEAVVVDSGTGSTVCARTEPLELGVHTMQYSVVDAADGREIRNYQFEVTADGAPTDAGACAGVELPEATVAATIEDRVAAGEDPGRSVSAWIVLGAAGLVVVTAAGLLLRAWRPRS